MNLILYIMIFITGSVFGSFFSLAVYRLPRKENITYVRSHCTSCDHKLNFLDLIPIFSYIFLRGKCRYCKDKIRIRYLLLEVFSGLVFAIIALSLRITAYSTLTEFINLFLIYLFVCSLFIIGGIDKENYIIHEGTFIYGIIVALAYGLYNAIVNGIPMTYNLFGFLSIPVALVVINLIVKQIEKDKDVPFGFGDIKFMALVGLFLGFGMQVLSLLLAIFITVGYVLIKKCKQIPFGYFLSISTVITIILTPVLGSIADLINVTMI